MSSMQSEQNQASLSIAPTLADNQRKIEEVFASCSDLVCLPWRYGTHMQYSALSVYFSTLIQQNNLNYMKETLQDLVLQEGGTGTVTPQDIINFFEKDGVSAQPAKVIDNFDSLVEFVMNGNVVIFFDQWDKALAYSALAVESRPISEPINEQVVQGPHMSSVEDIHKNMGLLRTQLKSPRFKFEHQMIGTESRKFMAYGYLEGAVDPKILEEFRRKISVIDKEEIMDTSYLEEWVGGPTYSPFPLVRYTERPDTAVAALLDGKIIALVDGSPTILICPGLFFEFFSSSEDYYQKSLSSSLIRILRVLSFMISLFLPSIYIALSTFHPELIPTVLLLAILDTREGIPYPAFFEALIMEICFEVLREAGVRLPRPIGSAVSIVGALVIGQAAIQAKIASPVMIIVVALTGIASFASPQYNMATAIRVLRFPFMFLAATLGGLGIMFGFLLTLLHLTSLHSLGLPYLSPGAPLDIKQFRDIVIVVPRKLLLGYPRNKHHHRQPSERK